MKLTGLRHVKFEQKKMPGSSAEVLCDTIIVSIPDEMHVTVYNLDQILSVKPAKIHETTYLDRGRVVKEAGESYEYMDITFINDTTIRVSGNLKTLER